MNVELARQALEAAKANPERFDMASWVSGKVDMTKDSPEFAPPCGTTACYAGWVAFNAAPVGSVVLGSYVTVPGAPKPVTIQRYAAEALDISPDQADTLFFLSNIREVERAVNYLADNPAVGGDRLWAVSLDGPADVDYDDEVFNESTR